MSCTLGILALASVAGLSCDSGRSGSTPPAAQDSRPANETRQEQGDARSGELPKLILYEQVTIFGIVLVPEESPPDPRLARFEQALRKFQPGYGFKLRAVRSKRLGPDDELTCDMGDGIKASTVLLDVERGGRVRLKFSLSVNGRTEATSIVTTPPNQLFFCKKKLKNGDTLLICVGAR